MKRKYIYLFVIGITLMGISCQKIDTTPGNNWAYPLSGNWTVKVNDAASLSDPIFIAIYSESIGTDSIWIDDPNTPFKAKAAVNMANKVFQTTEYNSLPDNPNANDLITIKNSKLVGTDSIYFEVQFASDTTGTVYKYAGHRKLSYEEYNTH